MDVINDYQQQLKDMKRVVTKTPLLTEEDHNILEEENDRAYTELKNDFHEFFQFLNDMVDPIINSESKKEEEEEVEDEKGPTEEDKDKKQTKKAPAKVEEEKESSEFQGKIESLVLLLDNEISMLPFESLKALQGIPAISRDFSIEMLYQRYKGMEFNKDNNECNPIAKDRMQYFSYEFKKDKKIPNIGKIYTQFQTQIPGSAFQGISTSD